MHRRDLACAAATLVESHATPAAARRISDEARNRQMAWLT
jgi:hypothetical protein